MILKKSGSLFVLLCLVVMIFFSFTQKGYNVNEKYVVNQLANLNRAFENLDKAAEDFKKAKIGSEALQKVFLETREEYKKAEFFLTFYHPEYVNSHLNGAPLLHIEKETSNPFVVEPEGLQVLDELLFSEELHHKKYEIASLSKKLMNNYALLYRKIGARIPDTKYSLTAMRLQLVRLFSMGVTGFDTPGSVNALPDAVASLTGMQVYFNQYHVNVSKQEADAVNKLFNNAKGFLTAASSFEKLDRFSLLTLYIDPLYKRLGNLQGVEKSEFLERTTAWNPSSESLFSADFLNPYFYTLLKKEEDNDNLKTLGKTLFYDPVISNDGKMSCASCHQPEKGFADGMPKSLSNIKGKTVLRNAPTLLNAAYADRYFYDLRAFTLEQQVEHVIFSTDEFNTAYEVILKKLNKDARYSKQFQNVFGKKEVITRDKVSKALASYVLSLQSFNSPLDKYVRGEQGTIPQDVKNGFNLFMGKANCATCHFAPTFSGLVPPLYTENESEILGVFEMPNTKRLDPDEGRLNNRIASENAWIYEKSFKTTTIRNVGETAPYFHNGAYKTLEEVVDFYNNGGGQGVGLSVQNQTLPEEKLNLSDVEKKELIAFMKALSDNSFK
ncbi:cytochrome c peroxidase [Flavobacterium enshiense]|uniref:cytochrome-c peroxidase n=1 Tax=Flavobacterium enshiense TaxID=1341165 RepID=UPI00345CEDD8